MPTKLTNFLIPKFVLFSTLISSNATLNTKNLAARVATSKTTNFSKTEFSLLSNMRTFEQLIFSVVAYLFKCLS